MENLLLGVGRTVITPPIGGQLYGYSPDVYSNALADDLTATAFWFTQGEREALMISLTVCLIHSDLADEILKRISDRYDIPAGQIILSATHTHSGPNTAGEEGWGPVDMEYCNAIFIPRILQAVEEAKQNREAVTMAAAVGESLVGINRRELTPDNKIVLGQNPWGIMDRRMTVLSFRNEVGQVVANMIHYGAHGTAAGCNHEITRDWSGRMTDALEEKTGGITAFFNGPQGDMGPRLSNGKTVGDLSYVRELGAVAARDVLRIYESLGDFRETSLSVLGDVVKVPLKPRMSREKAEEMLPQYKGKTVNLDGMIANHLEKVIASHGEDYREADAYDQKQTLVGLGDWVFATFPYELFSEIGLRIDAASDKHVLSLSNANGSEGYMVTRDAIVREGYEVGVFLYTHIQPWCDDADYHLVKGTLENLEKMM
ncbi:MAG: neutral/alkaline non-lysosomal ceramidase N-terminal domain-containing protein [Clostridia bacterium]|nr:neutral/alkaline non-lysosomal ceramidase N-terminal domain-containing protein [Clostridia bacterium]